MDYAASASDRPMSEGVRMSAGEPHPANANVNSIAPHTSAAYGSEMNGGAGYAGAPPVAEEGLRKTGGGTFLLATFVLGLIAWITSLVATSVVAATISGPAVRILWFAVVVQTITTLLVFQVLTSSSSGSRSSSMRQSTTSPSPFPTAHTPAPSGVQIAILSAIACVFAVFGVDQNIYSGVSSQQATGAGWLLVAITDLVWILYFTSSEGSAFGRVVGGFGGLAGRDGGESASGVVGGGERGRGSGWRWGGARGSGVREKGSTGNKVQKISRSTDAFNAPPVNANPNTNSRYDDQSVEMTKVGHGQEPSGQSSNPHQKRTASGKWSSHTPVSGPDNNTNPRGTMVSAGEHEEGGEGESEGGTIGGRGIPFGGTAAQMTAGGQHAPPISPGPEASRDGHEVVDGEAKWRAKALFEYKGSEHDPTELAFKKGEVLHIYDKSGKWWEAKNTKGRRGIAPSNYLQLL